MELNNIKIGNIVTKVGEFRVRNNDCLIELDGIKYTYSDLGGDYRFVLWRFGKWVSEGCKGDFEKEIMSDLEIGKVPILDFIKAHRNYELPEGCDERTWNYVASKCMKSINYGSTFPQIVAYIDNEFAYFEAHPRGKDGKRINSFYE